MLATRDVNKRLAGIVNENVKPEPDRTWQEIISKSTLN
jgi:hypothetical protein